MPVPSVVGNNYTETLSVNTVKSPQLVNSEQEKREKKYIKEIREQKDTDKNIAKEKHRL